MSYCPACAKSEATITDLRAELEALTLCNTSLSGQLEQARKDVAELKEDEGAGAHYREQLQIALKHLADAEAELKELRRFAIDTTLHAGQEAP